MYLYVGVHKTAQKPIGDNVKSHAVGIPCACNAPDIVQGTAFVIFDKGSKFSLLARQVLGYFSLLCIITLIDWQLTM